MSIYWPARFCKIYFDSLAWQLPYQNVHWQLHRCMHHQAVASQHSVWQNHTTAVRDLAPPGDLISLQTFSFEFNDVEMQYDSYKGLQVRLRSD